MADSFVHLHTHTEFSMLDGAARVNEVVGKAADDGQPAVGVMDHGNMYGVPALFKECKKRDIKAVVGTELYMVDDRFERKPQKSVKLDDSGGDDSSGKKMYYHLSAIAETNEGYRNLIQLSSKAYLEGYYRKPRVDWDLLQQHRSGLIVTTGCLGGMTLQKLMKDDYAGGVQIASNLKDIFGPEHLFVELQDHGIPEQKQTNPMLLKLAKDLSLPLVLMNDSHYVNQCDHETHDTLLCIQTGSNRSDPNRFKFHGDQHYVKTAAEMRTLFPDCPVAADNTLWIAERADVQIFDDTPKIPKFPLPEGFDDANAYLTHLVMEGAKYRWGDNLSKDVIDRISFELSVIDEMGFPDYFLIVWDLIRYARSKGVRTGPGRGSAAGAAVAYCLRITDLDPIKYDLLFERFLNPSRISMPDIDMDIDTRFRDEWIQYAKKMYGDDRVCQIITFTQIKARTAVKDVARVLDKPWTLGDQLSKAMPPLMMGRDTPIKFCLKKDDKHKAGYEKAGAFRELYESDPDAKEIVDNAMGLEGLRRQDGIHAAGVLICDRPLIEVVPIQRKSAKKGEVAPIVSQYEMNYLEDLGLLKMDFLGLTTLDIITDTVEILSENRSIELDIDNIPMDDEKTFELLQAAKTVGVFQLESSGMRDLIHRLLPTTFEDIGALVALYRPGPMDSGMHHEFAERKNGRKPVEYLHEDAEELLSDTQGIMLYQEEMMRIAQTFAGYSLAEADNLRKACGKKLPELMALEEDKFLAGCVKTGYSEQLAQKWFDLIRPFADYSFNKSHAYSYALIAYQTAYLKAHYPAEFMAALLSSVMGKHDKIRPFLNECRQLGIKVRVPDVNISKAKFSTVQNDDGSWDITYGMAAVRNIGTKWGELVVASAPYTDFYDFIDRLEFGALNKKSIESAVMAGLFDSLGHSRRGLLMVCETLVDTAIKRRKKEDVGQYDLFGTQETFEEFAKPVIPSIEYSPQELLAVEREMLGLYISSHPLDGVHFDSKVTINDVLEAGHGTEATVPLLVTELEIKVTKKGDQMAILTLEDFSASVEGIVFPIAYKQFSHLLKQDAILRAHVKLDARGDAPKLYVDGLSRLVLDDAPFMLDLPEDATNEQLVSMREILREHPGNSPVHLHTGSGAKLVLPGEMNVKITNELKLALIQLYDAPVVR